MSLELTDTTSIYKVYNNVLLSSIGNYTQYPIMNHTRKEYEKEYICDWKKAIHNLAHTQIQALVI